MTQAHRIANKAHGAASATDQHYSTSWRVRTRRIRTIELFFTGASNAVEDNGFRFCLQCMSLLTALFRRSPQRSDMSEVEG